MDTRTICALSLAVACSLAAEAHDGHGPMIESGDRIAVVGNTFADQLRTNGYLETLLLQHWPETPVSMRNLGWAGDTLSIRDRPTNFPTEESTLRDYRTDVIVACFGMGESFAGKAGIADFKTDLKAFIASHRGKSYNGASDARLILVSPIAYEQLGEHTPNAPTRNRDLRSYMRAMESVAAEEHLPFIDLFTPTLALSKDRQGIPLTTNGIHLNEYGYWAVAHILYDRLVGNENAFLNRSWEFAVDAKSGKTKANGLEISPIASTRSELNFTVLETTLPSLPAPVDTNASNRLSELRDTMKVTNLDPGSYSLVIDGEKVVSATHEEWARGLAIDRTPAHREAEAFRAAVNDKNLQFIYSWKALNQVHIVGERRHSPSGRALPAEIIEFKEISEQKEAALDRGAHPKSREWRLILDTN